MALDINFPQSLYAIQDPPVRRFPADEALRATTMEKLISPLVGALRGKAKAFGKGGYAGARGRRKVAVKVVDIFGTDPMTIVEANVEESR